MESAKNVEAQTHSLEQAEKQNLRTYLNEA